MDLPFTAERQIPTALANADCHMDNRPTTTVNILYLKLDTADDWLKQIELFVPDLIDHNESVGNSIAASQRKTENSLTCKSRFHPQHSKKNNK